MDEETREPTTRRSEINVHTGPVAGGEVSGIRFGDGARVGTIEADTVILQSYGAGRGATSAQVPPVARHTFVGRDDQKQKAIATLRLHRSVLVHGTVGIGKTALAGAVAIALHEQRVYPNGIVWISEIGQALLPAVCDAIARQLGDQDLPRLPAAAKPDALRSLLATRSDMLLVLDALEQPATAQDFLDHCLPPGTALLTTSQTVHPIFDEEIDLGPLPVAEAVRLFEDRARLPAGDALVERICDVVGYHPQAIVLAAGRRRAERIPLAALAERLGDETERLRALDGLDDDKRGLSASLSVAVNALQDGPRATFLTLAACFGEWTTVELLALARGIVPNACEDEVAQLTRRSLAEREDNGQLLLQRLVRDFGRGQPEPALLARQSAVLAAAVRYLTPAPGRDPSARLDSELSNLVGAARFAAAVGDAGATIAIVEAIGHPVSGPLAIGGHWEELVALLDVGCEATEKTHNERTQAAFCAKAGVARSRRGERRKAWHLFSVAYRLYTRLDDLEQRARVLHNLAKVLQDQSRFQWARYTYQRSLQMKEGTGDSIGIARTQHELGRLATTLGDYVEARQAFAQSLAVKTAARDRLGMAITMLSLARVDHIQGDYASARTLYDQSRELYEALEDTLGLALVEHGLGRLEYDQGNLDAAEGLYAASAEVFEDLHSAQELADLACDRAVLSTERGDYARAAGDFAVSLAMKARLGDVAGRAFCQFEQARCLRLQGNLSAVRPILNEATAVIVRLGTRAGQVRADFEAGCLERRTRGDDDAAPLLTRSLATAETLGLKADQAEAHEQLGEIAAARGDVAAARDHFVRCVELFARLNETRAARVRAHLV